MSDNRSETTEEEIAACAYFIWEQEGKPIGRTLDHWLQAELQLAASLWHESLRYEEARKRREPRPIQADYDYNQRRSPDLPKGWKKLPCDIEAS
jgi:Protein of unknown function (DUF2934)